MSEYEMRVEKTDRFFGEIIRGKKIICNFSIRPPEFNRKRINKIRTIEEYYSAEFLEVFRGCVLENNIIEGEDVR